MARSHVQAAWLGMAFIDAIIHYRWTLQRARARFDVVVCDRYVHDAELDLVLRFPTFKRLTRTCSAGLAALVPKPELQILYHVPLSVALERCEAKNEPFPDALPIRAARHAHYEHLAKRLDVNMIDAQRPLAEVHAATLRALAGVVPERLRVRLEGPPGSDSTGSAL